jgi:hypothetical protein
MWPFKKQPIDYYRIKKLGTKYYIERKLPEDFCWMTLHYWPSRSHYDWCMIPCSYAWSADSFDEARDKVSEFVPEYYKAQDPDFYYL